MMRLGLLGYGIAYGLASLGCSLPIFLSVVAYSAALGVWGLACLTTYLIAIFVSMVIFATLAAIFGHALFLKLGKPSYMAQIVAAVALIASGAFLSWTGARMV